MITRDPQRTVLTGTMGPELTATGGVGFRAVDK
jgi:hypothetical protein